MKKLIAKLRRKGVETPSRITNETVAEHRERILAGGRRFKYPLQYARHRLVFNTIIISVVAVAILISAGYWQLYSAQTTNAFFYNVTKVLPLPVASVDGQPVLYSDYLMRYRSALYNLEQKEQVNLDTEDGKRQADYHKQKAIEAAIEDAYGAKLAQQLDITVTDAELEAYIKSQRQSADGEISQQTYDAATLDILGWSPDEYRHVLRNELLRQKAAFAIDDTALRISNKLAPAVKAPGSNLTAIASESTGAGDKVEYGSFGWVNKNNQDGGLASAAAKLQTGEVSSAIKSTTGDGYYFVRLLETNDTQVRYEFIQIPLTEFARRLDDLYKNNKVVEYISVSKTADATGR